MIERKQVGYKIRVDLQNWVRVSAAKSGKPVYEELENILLWAKKLTETVVDVDKEIDRVVMPMVTGPKSRDWDQLRVGGPLIREEIVMPNITLEDVDALRAKQQFEDSERMTSYPPKEWIKTSSDIPEGHIKIDDKSKITVEPVDPRAAWFTKTGFDPSSFGPVKKKLKPINVDKYPNFGDD